MSFRASQSNPHAHLHPVGMNRKDANLLDPKNPVNKPAHVQNDFQPSGPLGPDTSLHRHAEPAIVNEADRFELFILGDGEKKVTEAADTRECPMS
jgi:hypothetical protein